MTEYSILFEWGLGDQVLILANARAGVVKGLWLDQNKIKWYFCEYQDANGLICSKYLTGDEIGLPASNMI